MERSQNGREWKLVGTKNVEDFAGSRTNYEFIDDRPLQGKNYYRLRTIDLDGTQTVSEVISVVNANPSLFNILVSPNPFTTTLYVKSSDNSEMLLNIYSAEGKKIASHSWQSGFNVNTSSWRPGIYLLQVTCRDGSVSTYKVVKD